MEKIKAAIVGCGRISKSYRKAFHLLENQVQLVYAVDKIEERAKAVAEEFRCNYETDFEKILDKDIDVIHLSLPHDLHASFAIKAMRAGKHVLTEKPIALTLQDADQMIKVSEETGMKLGCIFQTRYTSGVTALKQMIADGKFGKILGVRSYLTWDRPQDYYAGSDWKGTWSREGGGVLIDQAIHSIDRVRYMLGCDVSWINGSIHNYAHDFVKVEDTADAAIMFENGTLYNLYATNIYAENSPITIEFFGEKGKCGLIRDKGYYQIGDEYVELPNDNGTGYEGPSYWGNSHHVQLEDFYRSVRENTPVAVDGIEGKKTLEIIKGIYLSSTLRQKITLPFEDCMYTEIK